MIDSFGKLFDMLTIFFNTAVFENQLFLGMTVFTTVFAVIFIGQWFFDGGFVRW